VGGALNKKTPAPRFRAKDVCLNGRKHGLRDQINGDHLHPLENGLSFLGSLSNDHPEETANLQVDVRQLIGEEKERQKVGCRTESGEYLQLECSWAWEVNDIISSQECEGIKIKQKTSPAAMDKNICKGSTRRGGAQGF